ncbi:MAG: hypothetical protein PHR68_04760 [Candidatus Gracilibacteria bacterium]|nr:hypothetical protein [Candidatus Gracilibacteria bacterium]
MSISFNDEPTYHKNYSFGKRLIVLFPYNSFTLKRKIRRIIDFGRIDSISFKSIEKMATKVVVKCTEKKVFFSDGTVSFKNHVCSPEEFRDILHHLDIKRISEVKSESFLVKFFKQFFGKTAFFLSFYSHFI